MKQKSVLVFLAYALCVSVGMSIGFLNAKITQVLASTLELYPLNSCTKQPKQSPNDINVVTYNIGGRNNCGDGCAGDRVKNIKKLIAEYNFADIIGLQEASIIKRKTNSTPAYVEEEFKQFQSQFSGYTFIHRGHQDVPEGQSKGMNSGQWYGNMIITKFPMREGSYREFLLMKNPDLPRYFISVILETPAGPLRVFNIHTRCCPESDAAWGVTQAIAFMQEVSRTEPDIPFIVLGDFNQTIGKLVGPLTNPQNGLSLSIECENTGICFKGHIDFIFPGGKTKLMERCQGTRKIDSQEIDGDHLPVYAVIRLPESGKPGDLDRNNKVDIFDYNMLLGEFGKTGTPGFHPADIIKNGAVDIFDYNEMLKALATP